MQTFAYFFLIEPLVHKLLWTITKFMVSFIKTPVLLKISEKARFSLCLKLQIN